MVSNLGELEVLLGEMIGAGATSIQESNFLFSLAIMGVGRNFMVMRIKPVICRAAGWGPGRRKLNNEAKLVRARNLRSGGVSGRWLSLLTSCSEARKERWCLLGDYLFSLRGLDEMRIEDGLYRDHGRKYQRRRQREIDSGYEWMQVDGGEHGHVF